MQHQEKWPIICKSQSRFSPPSHANNPQCADVQLSNIWNRHNNSRIFLWRFLAIFIGDENYWRKMLEETYHSSNTSIRLSPTVAVSTGRRIHEKLST
ncbi:hypothetical protein CDAR_1111 [Caerostris darwini]|uniref:Uncharacterized protein n=1 Tax=Caerostris darwini TaxID=1538125 RepID=A0AAV4SMR4_9ARAC|nr:hypothetical protein CDAR_921 [Caerostris darwini]GIY35306.1 hypothetical protein CDAR_1111 [Caerostris darwini]